MRLPLEVRLLILAERVRIARRAWFLSRVCFLEASLRFPRLYPGAELAFPSPHPGFPRTRYVRGPVGVLTFTPVPPAREAVRVRYWSDPYPHCLPRLPRPPPRASPSRSACSSSPNASASPAAPGS